MATPSTLSVNSDGLSVTFSSTVNVGAWGVTTVDVTKSITILIGKGGSNERTRTVLVTAATVTLSTVINLNDTVSAVFSLLHTGIYSGETVEIVSCDEGILTDAVIDSEAMDEEDTVTNSSSESAPVVSITERTTTADKYLGCGYISCHARGSTLGFGRPCQQEVAWSAPGWSGTMTTTDPRRGAQNGDTIDAAGGDWRGWSYPLPCSVAGTHSVKCDITDIYGYTATATKVLTEVLAQSGFISRFVDSSATGTDNGLTPTNAYVSVIDALTDADTTGSKVNIFVAKGHTETPSSTTDVVCDNLNITTYGSGDNPLYDLQTAAKAWTLTGENITVENQDVTDTVNTDTSGAFVQTTVAVDMMVKNCNIHEDSNTFLNFIVIQPTLNAGVDHVRLFAWDCDSSVGASRYSGVFATYQELDVLGGYFGPTTVEHGNRLNEAWGGGESHGTFVGNRGKSGHKNLWRFHDGSHFTMHRCHGEAIDGASTVVVLGESEGTPDHTTISACDLWANSTTGTFPFRADMDPTDTGDEDICIRNSVLEKEGTADSARPIEIKTAGNTQRAYITGNTVINNANMTTNTHICDVGPAVECVIENNIFKATDTVNNKLSVLFTNCTSYKNNDLDVGGSTDSTPYKANGDNRNVASVNSQSYASGNADKTHTIDSNFLPASPSTAPIAPGQYTDYYGHENTIGDTDGYRGAVDFVPVTPVSNQPLRSSTRYFHYYKRR